MNKKNNNAKPKFNFLDVIIIVLVLGAAAVGYKYFLKTSEKSSNVSEISYVVELRRKGESYREQIKPGDDISDAIKGGYYGKVTDVKWEKCVEINQNAESGEYVKAEVEDRYNYYITITGIPTTYTDSKIMFASQEVRVGNEIYIRSKNYSGEGYVVDINAD